jgi:hypothetical protein
MYEETRRDRPTDGHVPWNKGKLTGQKRPFTLKQIWEIRIRLQIAERTRGLAVFNLGIDSKLRGCALARLLVRDVAHGDQILSRTRVIQKKTDRPVSFELTSETRGGLETWIAEPDYPLAISCSSVAPTGNATERRASMHGSCTNGSS